ITGTSRGIGAAAALVLAKHGVPGGRQPPRSAAQAEEVLVATLPFGNVLADAPRSKDAKVTLVYQHELPNVPGKSIKGVLVEYGPGGYSPGHTNPPSSTRPCLRGRSAVRSTTDR